MFRELTRKNKQISTEECIEILVRERRGVLAVSGDGGYPYAMPMNYLYNTDDGCIYFHTGRGGHRLDALLRSPKVSFCICENGCRAAGEWAYTVRSVIAFGKVEIIDDTEQVREIATRLSHKFTNDEDYIKSEIDKYATATLLLKLTPEHICGKRVVEA